MTGTWLILLLVPLGLGTALYGRSAHVNPGLTLLGGFCLLALALFALPGVTRSLHTAAIMATAGAALALVLSLARGWRDPWLAVHPLVVFGGLVAVVLLIAPPTDYLIYAWDEWTNWLGWGRQMVVADRFYAPGMHIATRGDTPGWTLLFTFHSLLSGVFDPLSAVLAATALHIALWSAAYDLLRHYALHARGLSQTAATIASWIFVLAAITAEATWKLVPTLLLIEEPQIYLLAAIVFVALAQLQQPASPNRGALLLGLLAATAWLFKTSFITFLPAYALLALALAAARRRDAATPEARLQDPLAILALMGGPLVLTVILWRLLEPEVAARCQADLGAILSAALQDRSGGDGLPSFAQRLAHELLSFLVGWKTPLTLLALSGLALAAFTGWTGRAAALALAGYGLTHAVGIYSGMAACFSEQEIAELASATRYFRVPMRVLHATGFFILALVLLDWLKRRGALAARLERPPILLAGLVFCLLALIWQAREAARSFADLAQRPNVDADMRAMLDRVRAEAVILREYFAAHPAKERIVLVVARDFGHEATAGYYEGLGRQRGEALQTFRTVFLKSPITEEASLRSQIDTADGIWIFADDPRVTQLLAPRLSADACRTQPARFLIVRDGAAAQFQCLLRP